MQLEEFADSCIKIINYNKREFEWYSEYAGDKSPFSNYMFNPELKTYDKEALDFLRRDKDMRFGEVLYYFNLCPILTLRAFVSMKQMRERHKERIKS